MGFLCIWEWVLLPPSPGGRGLPLDLSPTQTPQSPRKGGHLGPDTTMDVHRMNAPSFPRSSSPRVLNFHMAKARAAKYARRPSPSLVQCRPMSSASKQVHPPCGLQNHLVQEPLTWASAAPPPGPSHPPCHAISTSVPVLKTFDWLPALRTPPGVSGPLASPPGSPCCSPFLLHGPLSSHRPSFLPQDICTCSFLLYSSHSALGLT